MHLDQNTENIYSPQYFFRADVLKFFNKNSARHRQLKQ